MEPISDNFLAPEAAIVQRLQDTVQAELVGTARDMEQIDERAQRTPAVYVLFDGLQPQETAGSGQVQRIEQTWMVVGAVRNIEDQAGGSAAREDAGRLLSQILAALQGYKPHPDLGRLALQASGQPEHNAGFMYIPTTWTASTTTRGQKQ